MAFGTHWEWRAFGDISADFERRFETMTPHYPLREVLDTYLFIPESWINAKFRVGGEGGLKFKRMIEKEGELELWREMPDDHFNFPLSTQAWKELTAILAHAGIDLGPHPVQSVDRVSLVHSLNRAGCRTVEVRKRRESHLFSGENLKIIVDVTTINHPQVVKSVGLEPFDSNPLSGELPEPGHKKELLFAIDELGLKNPSLRSMNYVEAAKKWIDAEMV